MWGAAGVRVKQGPRVLPWRVAQDVYSLLKNALDRINSLPLSVRFHWGFKEFLNGISLAASGSWLLSAVLVAPWLLVCLSITFGPCGHGRPSGGSVLKLGKGFEDCSRWLRTCCIRPWTDAGGACLPPSSGPAPLSLKAGPPLEEGEPQQRDGVRSPSNKEVT